MNEKDGTKQILLWTSKEKPPSWLQGPSSITWLERENINMTFNHLVIQIGPTVDFSAQHDTHILDKARPSLFQRRGRTFGAQYQAVYAISSNLIPDTPDQVVPTCASTNSTSTFCTHLMFTGVQSNRPGLDPIGRVLVTLTL